MKKKILLSFLIILMFCSLSVICAEDNSTIMQDNSQAQNSINYEIKSTDSSNDNTIISSTNDNKINEVSSAKSTKKTTNYTKDNTKETALNSDNLYSDTSKSLKTSGNEYYFNSSVTGSGDGSKNNPWNTINQTNFNSITNGSTVYIASGQYTVNDLDISINVNIIGENVNNTIITSSNADKTLNIKSVVTINNITFNNTKTTTIENNGNLTLNNCIFKNNIVEDYVSAGITNRGNLTINYCTFNNISSKFASAIDNQGDSKNNLNINTCIFDYCGFKTSNYYMSGVLYSSYSNVSINSCNFTNNYAYYGSTIYNSHTNLTISNSKFKNNGQSYTRDMLYSYRGSLYISNTVFLNNTSLYGTLSNREQNVVISGSTFVENKAKYMGGSIYLISSKASVDSTKFTNNSATNGTGGVFYVYDSDLAVNNSVFDNNYALFGAVGTFLNGSGDGSEIIESKHNSSITSSTFTNNKAYYDGGVIYDVYSNLNIKSSNFTNNTARNGGVIYGDYAILEIDGNKFENNTAQRIGGAIYTNQINMRLTNNNFTNNKVTNANDIYAQYSESFNQSNNKQSSADSIITSTITTINTPEIVIGTINNTYNGSLPSSYDLRELNQVTSVKTQSGGGNCWAFATIATLESCLLKATGISYDLSENNMKNIMALFSEAAWCISPNNGGYDEMPITYLVNWYGPVLEDEDSYIPDMLISAKIDNLFQINDVYAIPSRTNFTDNDLVKEALMKYGGVYTDILWRDSYLNSVTSAYYSTSNDTTNHAVCIVGWDDNYSKTNFKTQPAGDGAFIIKNSYGTDSGDNGYYYVSYYDTSILNSCDDILYAGGFTFILNDTEYYDRIYQYDFGGLSNWLELDGYNNYSNEFISNGNDYIKAFGTFVADTSSEYTAKIYVNGVLQHTQTGKFSHLGYETVKLTKAIPVKENDSMKILLEFSTDSTVLIPISDEDYTRVVSTTKSLVNDNSSDWFIVCLKLYTVSADQSQINAIVTKTNATGSQILITVNDAQGNYLSNGTVTVYDNNNKINTITISSNQTYLNLDLSKGTHNITFVYDSTGYQSSNNSVVVTVGATKIDSTILNNTVLNTTIKVVITDVDNNRIPSGTIKIYNKTNSLLTQTTFTNGETTVQLTLPSGNQELIIVYDGDNTYLSSNATQTVNVNNVILDAKISLPDYSMYILDYSSIVVNVTDEYGNPVNGGYLIFKVNGVTLKSNGKFYSQETNPMKFNVTNGKATIVFNATSFYNKNYVHSIIVKYSGISNKYNSASSDTKTLTINKRLGYMTVTTDKSSYNLYETVTIKATYYDTTHGTTQIYTDSSCYAIYKINGITSKVNGTDEKFAINNSQITIGNNSKSQINYIHVDYTGPNNKEYQTIEVKTHNEYYTTLVANTTITLNKSPTHIDVNKVTFNKTSNKITISADIKDYKNNNTEGTNYYSIKINGITCKVQGKTTLTTTGGNIEITIDSTTQNVRNIELVTGEKLAYEGSRTTTTNIQTVK